MAIRSPRRFISRKVWMVTREVFIPPSLFDVLRRPPSRSVDPSALVRRGGARGGRRCSYTAPSRNENRDSSGRKDMRAVTLSLVFAGLVACSGAAEPEAGVKKTAA